MHKRTVFVLVLIALVLVACGGGQPAGNAANGQALFTKATIGNPPVPGCSTCHSVEKDKKIVGPSLYGVGTDATGAFKEAGYKGSAKSANDWLREAITNPNVDIVEGFQPNLMPQNYAKILAEQEISDLVAYLSTLK